MSGLPTLADSLDIWRIIDKELGLFEEMAVDSAVLDISVDEVCTLQVNYFDLTSLIDNGMYERPKICKVDLKQKESENIIRSIMKYAGLEGYVRSLYLDLKNDEIPYMKIDLVPIKKEAIH